jgi:hypothetical protein
MGRPAILKVSILSDADNKGFQSQDRAASKWQKGLAAANRAANVAIVGIAALGTAATKSASRAQQAAGAIESVFGKQADSVKRLARGAADSVGLATSQYSELASVLGSQLRNLGISEDKLVGTTDDLISKGADLAATFGGTTADAVQALSALMRGERDPIERYGVSIKQADINAQLAKQGLDKLTGAARKQAETNATLALLTEQTAAAQGQFARETTSAAGAAQIAAANAENAKAAIGEALLPVVAAAAQKFAALARWVQNNTAAAQGLVVIVGGLAVAVKLVNAATAVYTATTKVATATAKLFGLATKANTAATVTSTAVTKGATAATAGMTLAQRALALAMRAVPIFAVIGLIASLVAIVVTAYKRSETFRNVVNRLGRVAKAAFKAILNAAKPLISIVQRIVGWVQSLISAIRNIRWPEPPGWVKSIGSAIGGLFGASPYPGGGEPGGWMNNPAALDVARRVSFMPHLGGGSSDPDALATLAALASGGGMTVINVNGALDPDAVARQIERLLRRRASRTGRGVITRTVTA